jgi:hypothetical protein
MRDRLKRAYIDNLPVKNPTQTRYTRFMKSPAGRTRTAFDRVSERLATMKDWSKASHYSKYMES